MTSSLSAVPLVVGSVMQAHTEPMTDTTITGLLTALRRASHSAAQVVISCHCAPRPTRIGLMMATTICAQKVGFFKRTFHQMQIARTQYCFLRGTCSGSFCGNKEAPPGRNPWWGYVLCKIPLLQILSNLIDLIQYFVKIYSVNWDFTIDF